MWSYRQCVPSVCTLNRGIGLSQYNRAIPYVSFVFSLWRLCVYILYIMVVPVREKVQRFISVIFFKKQQMLRRKRVYLPPPPPGIDWLEFLSGGGSDYHNGRRS